jgi:hypothetical protein
MKRFFLALTAAVTAFAPALRADDPAVPGGSFPSTRYEALWSKSPFAVATPEPGEDASPDYALAGIAKVDSVSYASIIDNHNNEHFVVSSDKPDRGLTLTSISRSSDGKGTFAIVQKNGQAITLKLQPLPAAIPVPGQPGAPTATSVPNNMAPQILMPGSPASFNNAGSTRPFTRIHRPPIHLPNPPPVEAPPPPAQPQTAPAPRPPPGQ